MVQAIFLLRFTSAALLAATEGHTPSHLLLGTTAWTLAVFTVYLVNGIHDAVEDTVNHPTRPIPAGTLHPRTAARVALASAALALASASLAGPCLLALTAVFLLAGHLYSAPGIALKKHTAGTTAVVLTGGLTTYLAGFAAAGGHHLTAILVPATAMSLWMALVGAVAKDFTDITGDRRAGRRTTVIRLGPTRARRRVTTNALLIGTGFLAAAAAVLPPLVPSAAATLAGAVALSITRFPYRVYMRTQYAAHLLAFGVLAFAILSP